MVVPPAPAIPVPPPPGKAPPAPTPPLAPLPAPPAPPSSPLPPDPDAAAELLCGRVVLPEHAPAAAPRRTIDRNNRAAGMGRSNARLRRIASQTIPLPGGT